MTHRLLSALVIASLCGACGESQSTTSPSSTTTPPRRFTEYFTGNLSAQESPFFSFTGTVAGTTDITLIGLTPVGAPTLALTTPMGMGIGTPAGTGCRLSSSLTAQPGLTAQLSASTTAAIYCVDIHDIGTVTDPLNFTVRIVHP